jgi:hypothetical protein
MRALALVTARELRAQAPAAAAALLVALLPWVTPLLPGLGHAPASDLRAATATILALLFGFVLALFTGAGLLARDLGEGRMGFFLALPLRTGTLWTGRLLAAVVLVYGSIAVVLLPATGGSLGAGHSPVLVAAEELLRESALGQVIAFLGLTSLGRGVAVLVALLPLFLILLASQLATALRSRSAWLLLDAGGLVLAAALAVGALRRLFAAAAPVELVAGAGLLAALALLAWLLGGAFGLARGRTLLGRVHRAQAVATSVGLLAAASALAGFGAWVVRFDLRDVTQLERCEAAPAGSWTTCVATLRHRPSYRPALLFDTATGTMLPLGAAVPPRVDLPGFAAPITFAADGRSVVWARPDGHPFMSPGELVWVELAGTPRTVGTGIRVAPWNTTVELAGERLAVAEPERLAVWGERGRRLLAAARLPRGRGAAQLRWLGDGRVRLLRLSGDGDEPQLEGWDLDPSTSRLTALPRRSVRWPSELALSADGERLLLAHGLGGRAGVELLDPASGATLVELAPEAAKGVLRTAAFLGDGEVALVDGTQDTLRLRLYDRQGALRREVPLGAGRYAWLGTLWAPGRLPFTASVRAPGSTESHPLWQGELREVDLAAGVVRVLGGRLAPLTGASPWWSGDDRVAVGSPASRLFRDAEGALVRRDPDGATRRLLPLPG